MHDNKAKITLQKKLNPLNVWALAFGCIIGWGAFVMPGNTFLPSAGPGGTAIALVIGMFIMITISFNYSYMIPKYPVAGGEFSFTKETLGTKNAFICAWFLVLAYIANVPMNASALGLVGRYLFPGLLQNKYLYTVAGYDIYLGEVIFSVSTLVILALLSIRGISVSGWLQTILAMSLFLCIIILVFYALCSPVTSIRNLYPLFIHNKETTRISWKGIISVLAVSPWAFVGFDTIPQASEEFNFPMRKVNCIMIIAMLFGGFVYIAMNTITASISPWENFLKENYAWATGAAIKTLMGIPGLIILGCAIISAILTGILGFLMASSRLIYSLACSNFLPEWFSKLHSKYKTPVNAIFFCLLVSVWGPWLGRQALSWFVDMSAIGAAIGYGYTCIDSFIQQKKDKTPKIWLKTSAILGTVFSFLFIIMLVFPGMPAYLAFPSRIMLFSWIILGVLFYRFRLM